MCSHCGHTCHDKKNFWQLIGFPELWTEHSREGERSGRGRSRRRGRSQPRSNAVLALPTSVRGTCVPSLSAEQWASLAALLDHQKYNPVPDKLNGKKQIGEVILNTGASHYMTGDERLLTHCNQ